MFLEMVWFFKEMILLIFGADNSKNGPAISVNDSNMINSMNDFLILPNPSNGNFQIELINKSSKYNMTILTLQGKIVYNTSFSQQICNLDLNLIPGLYIVVIKTKSWFKSKKLFIKSK